MLSHCDSVDKSLIVLFVLTLAIVTNHDYPAGTVLLETLMRNGEISYQEADIVQREDQWLPGGEREADLMERYNSTPEATVKFVSGGSGVIRLVVTAKETPWWHKFLNCFLGCLSCMRSRFMWCLDCMRSCFVGCLGFMRSCFMGCIRCMRRTWAWLRDSCRC